MPPELDLEPGPAFVRVRARPGPAGSGSGGVFSSRRFACATLDIGVGGPAESLDRSHGLQKYSLPRPPRAVPRPAQPLTHSMIEAAASIARFAREVFDLYCKALSVSPISRADPAEFFNPQLQTGRLMGRRGSVPTPGVPPGPHRIDLGPLQPPEVPSPKPNSTILGGLLAPLSQSESRRNGRRRARAGRDRAVGGARRGPTTCTTLPWDPSPGGTASLRLVPG